MDIITILVLVLGVAFALDRIYAKVNIDKYSPIWEYFFKAFLYGLIMIFTLLYGKDSINDVSPLEWAIIAVSGIEGTGNYINYLKESKKKREEKRKFKKM